MRIGAAIQMVQEGTRMRRDEWPKHSFIYLVPAAAYPAQRGAAKEWAGEDAMIPYPEYLAYANHNGEVRAWVPTHVDLLAADWQEAL